MLHFKVFPLIRPSKWDHGADLPTCTWYDPALLFPFSCSAEFVFTKDIRLLAVQR
jgi:hypothetical protein